MRVGPAGTGIQRRRRRLRPAGRGGPRDHVHEREEARELVATRRARREVIAKTRVRSVVELAVDERMEPIADHPLCVVARGSCLVT